MTTGQQLNFAIKNTTLFPVMITQMVGIGEESGALDGMLDKCAVYYEAEVDNAVDGLTCADGAHNNGCLGRIELAA